MGNFALIGCGAWGKNYLKTIENLPEMNLKYVYDKNQPSIPIPENIILTHKLDEVLNDQEVESVIVAIPTQFIFEVVEQCLKAGKNVLMEKPMTDSSEKAERLIILAKEKNLILMVGHIFLYHPAINKLKELINAGELGKILHIYSIRAAPGPVRNADEVNALWDLAPHDISIFLYLLGKEPTKVKAYSSDFLRPGIIDSASFSLRFGEVLAEAHVRWLDAEKIRKITIIGDKKIAIFDELAENQLKIYNKKVEFVGEKAAVIDEGMYAPEIEKKSPLEKQCLHFLDCVANKIRPLTDGENGKQVVKILEQLGNSFENFKECWLDGKKRVKFLDLNRIHDPLKPELMKSIEETIDSNAYILGKRVEEFEEDFAKFHGLNYGVGVDTGTSALELSLKALGIGNGDEVILPANTFIATASAVVFAGATPVLVDCDEYYNLDIRKIQEKITPKTKAIIPVHLYGQSADMGGVMEIANRNNLYVIEDACQSHGAIYHEKRVGNSGHLACFSFFPGKNLGAFGDGGMVLTNNEELANKLKMLRNYGQSKKYYHDFFGYNKRLDALQAGILKIKLTHLDEWNSQRRYLAQKYKELLKGIPGIVLPSEQPDRNHVYHLFVVRVTEREKLMEFLQEKEIDTGMHYPIPIHLQKSYAGLGYREGDFPVAERYAKEIVSLPIFPGLTDEEVEYVCEKIHEFYGASSSK